MATLRNFTWLIIARVTKTAIFTYYYDVDKDKRVGSLEDALYTFWTGDYEQDELAAYTEPEGYDTRFPIDVYLSLDKGGTIDEEYHLMFNSALFHYYYAKGRMPWKEFLDDLTLHYHYELTVKQTIEGKTLDTIVEDFDDEGKAQKRMQEYEDKWHTDVMKKVKGLGWWYDEMPGIYYTLHGGQNKDTHLEAYINKCPKAKH